jgi:DNA-directed RNA polymerase subunit K/omega
MQTTPAHFEVVRMEYLNRFERARLIGARALQLASGAPPLISVPKGTISAVKVAFLEFEKDALPLAVLRE